ncbi:MAG: transporter [Proteobacteria bacterium]|nr:transporter [Pseudomonadota bacterium]
MVLGLVGIPSASVAQGDGPRAYFPVPDDLHTFTGYGIFLRGNQSASPGTVIEGADLDLDLGVIQYTHPLSIFGNAAGAFAAIPFGSVEGTVELRRFSQSGSSSGLADIQLGAVIGLVGAPALSRDEYAEFEPGFAMGAIGKLLLPTGDYDSDRVINLGGNRWGGQLGLGFFYYRGRSYLDPYLTTVELIPSVGLFADNDDPFGGDRLEQDPLFMAEGHITQNIHRALWVSFDLFYEYGGETFLDGVAGDDAQSSLALGGSLGLNLPYGIGLKASYGEVVARNDGGADGRMFRVIATFSF